MDFNSSMFPFDETDELFQLPSIQQDELQVTPYPDCSKQNNSRQRKSLAAFGDSDENPNDNKKKKILHKDLERQRRQRIATLYDSLRSLLPLEYLKAGVEVVMSSALEKDEKLPLSRVLQVIVGEGLSIVSCISTKEMRDYFTLLNLR
nr:basic helix-loop-helix transcription factor [Loropetalum chinense var. rubrum]